MDHSAKRRKAALVTGASGGIGLELAKLLAEDGFDLGLAARSAERLDELAEKLRQEHRIQVVCFPLDLSQAGAASRLFESVEKQGMAIDVLINNAGFGVYGEFSKTPLADELRMIALNVSALTELTKLFLPGMLRRGSGRIMNLSSTAAFQPGPLMAVYYATKAYVLSFSEALAEELRGSGVTVTAVCPGATSTEFQARSSMGKIALLQLPMMSAESVARIGYEGMLKGRRIVVTGIFNRFGAFSVRFAPRALVTRIVRRVMSEAKSHN